MRDFQYFVFQSRHQIAAALDENPIANNIGVHPPEYVQRPTKDHALNVSALLNGDVLGKDQPFHISVNENVSGDELANEASVFVNDREAARPIVRVTRI